MARALIHARVAELDSKERVELVQRLMQVWGPDDFTAAVAEVMGVRADDPADPDEWIERYCLAHGAPRREAVAAYYEHHPIEAAKKHALTGLPAMSPSLDELQRALAAVKQHEEVLLHPDLYPARMMTMADELRQARDLESD